MRIRSTAFSLLFFSAAIILSCKTAYRPQSVKFVDYRIAQPGKSDSSFVQLLQPYADSVNKSMNELVVVSEVELEKKQPESNLGNIMADAMLAKAKEVYKTNVDLAVVNYGGIRANSFPAGNITRGKVFELCPFDNIMLLLKLDGKTLQLFLDHISSRGGWPVAGAQWQIKNKKAANVLIGGKPISENEVYTMTVVDYVANGGDDCSMLRGIPQINNGYLFRDALTAYFTDLHKQGKKLSPKIENRVTNAE